MKTKIYLLFIAACVAVSPDATAQDAGNVVPFQGQLANQSGQPLSPNSPSTLAFRLYRQAVGGIAIWEESQPNNAVNAGRFSVLLGSRTELPAAPNFNTTLYLGITVDNGDSAITYCPLEKVRSKVRGGSHRSAAFTLPLPTSLAALQPIPKGLRPPALGCEARATLGKVVEFLFNPNGVASVGAAGVLQPRWGWKALAGRTQGSSVRAGLANLATLGFTTESRWDSAAGLPKLVGKTKAFTPLQRSQDRGCQKYENPLATVNRSGVNAALRPAIFDHTFLGT